MIASLCENVTVIDKGKIIEEGKTKDILQNQKSDIARQIIQDTKKLYEV